MGKKDEPSIPRGRIERLSRIAGMATRVGAGLAKDRVMKLLGNRASPAEAAATRVLETLGNLKGVALKAGQTLSLFANNLPPEARLVLSKLYSQAPRISYAEIAQVIREELGGAPEEVFAEFSPEPLAAASLGQVHAALTRSGERVAVKVQYPGVGQALKDDLQNVGTVLKAVGILFDNRAYLEEIRRELLGELDYERERVQLERFRGFLSRWPDLVVPLAYPALSTKRVLTLELLEGPTLSQVTAQAQVLPAPLRWHRADQLLRAGWGPLLYDRAVHADAHPGNYVLLADGRLGVLDFGSVKFLSEPFWRAAVDALEALVQDREVDWVELLRRGGFALNLPEDRARRLVGEIVEVARRPVMGERDFGADTTLAQLAALKFKYPLELLRIQPPAEALLVARGLAGVLQNLVALRAKGDLRPFFIQALQKVRPAGR